MDKNLDIPGHWGMTRVEGVPNVLIVDSHDRLVNAGHTSALSDARHMSPQALADYLARLDLRPTGRRPSPPWQ